MNIKDFNVFGCSLYSIPESKDLFGFWLEEKLTGNSELLFVTKERFFRETGIVVDNSKSFILNCKTCVNTNCQYNPKRSFRGSTKDRDEEGQIRFVPYLGDQNFLNKRAETRINISLNVKLLPLSDIEIDHELNCKGFDKYFPGKILNITSKGCMLTYTNEYEDMVPDIGDNLEIMFTRDVYINHNGDSKDVLVYKFSNMSPIICEVMWRMSGNMGVQFIISRKKDINMIESFLSAVKNSKFEA